MVGYLSNRFLLLDNPLFKLLRRGHIANQTEKAVDILQTKNFGVVVNDVLIIETDDKPGGLSRMLKLLERDDIRIEYSYTAASDSPATALMVFRFADNLRAASVLEKNGLHPLKTEA